MFQSALFAQPAKQAFIFEIEKQLCHVISKFTRCSEHGR